MPKKKTESAMLSTLPVDNLAFLALALHGGKWSFDHGEEYWYPVDMRVVGAHRGVKFEFPPEIETQLISLPALSLVTNILIELYLFLINF